jgi:hypothetical protein
VSIRRAPRSTERAEPAKPAPPRVRKREQASRVRLTHLEIRRGKNLRIRIAVADDALAEVGDELGALVKKIAPSTRTTTIAATPSEPDPDDFVVSRMHADDDDAYHATLREHLAELISSLCDTALADTLKIAREESARRAEGGN